MRLSAFTLSTLLFTAATSGCATRETRRTSDYPVDPVPLSQVDIADDFWAPKIEVNRTVSIQHLFRKYEERGRTDAPRAIEAAAYMIAKRPDPALESYVDRLIDDAVAGLERRLAKPVVTPPVSGNFLEAAVAYFEATGKRKMLDAAIKAADAMDATFGPGKKTYISGHEGLKIGLIRLYRQTGDARYARLAQFFMDERGKDDYPRTGEYAIDRTYAQDHAPVTAQREALGHAVRATYLYVPLADVAALTAKREYDEALDAIWQDASSHKTYVTGAIGSIRFHEQFGGAYELPNLSAWNETCASYGYILWNHRMFLRHREGRYLDLMERTLYNGFLAGVSIAGDRFFYQNPLTSYGNYERFDWINVPCCPPNVVRLLASLGSYVYARETDNSVIYVNLFVGSSATVRLADNPVKIRQETRYPWEGRVKIAVDPAQPATFDVAVRIPGWIDTEVMPGGLYQFMNASGSKGRVSIRVNGRDAELQVVSGFARIQRRWQPGDVVELTLPMPVRRVVADERVKDDEGRVALSRGPLVYAAEWLDNGGRALNVVVPDDVPLTSEYRSGLLNGVEVITGSVQALSPGRDGQPQSKPHQLVAIPYYAWANRGMGEMQVWLPRQAEQARMSPVALPAALAGVRSSGGIDKRWTGYNDQNDDIAAVYDGIDPLNSADESHLYFRMRPPSGKPAWVEYTFRKPTPVSSAEVYWADDRRFCRLPTSWRVLYKDGSAWKPVEATSPFAVEKDRFNRVDFAPVTTMAVRMEVEPATRHYKSGEIGPPDAMFLDSAIAWREFGIVEFRVR